MYRLNKGNVLCEKSVAYQVEQLRGVDAKQAELDGWPLSRGPLFVAGGQDEGWTLPNGTKPSEPKTHRPSLDEAVGSPRGLPVVQHGAFSTLHSLKTGHGIETYNLVKAAIAIFNVEQTGTGKAMFWNCEAGRAWPFVDSWIAQHLPNVMNVAGPTMGASFDFIQVDPAETAGAFLRRMFETQKLQSLHANAPWDTVCERAGFARGSGDFGSIIGRQWTNWDGSYQSRAQQASSPLQLIDRATYVDAGVFWNFGQPRPGVIEAFLLYDDVHLSHVEAQQAIDRVFEVLRWLAVPAHLESSLGGIIGQKS